MNRQKRIEALEALGTYILKKDVPLQKAVNKNYLRNQWFTKENQYQALEAVVHEFLDKEKLNAWLANYPSTPTENPKNIGLILAGNIPLVGFHDFLTVWLSGNNPILKLSSKDEKLLLHLLAFLKEECPDEMKGVNVVDRLAGFDAVIATGSNNSSRYFEQYFGKYPNIIRKNRNAVAVLSGKETPEQIKALGHDMFDYFGLGCRNVSKVYVPKDFDFVYFLDHLESFKFLMDHHKYKNNYDYNRSILLLNRTEHFASDYVMLRENPSLPSPLSVVNYEYYTREEDWKNRLIDDATQIQCVVGDQKSFPDLLPFGSAQKPSLMDYADGVDTMAFCLGLGDQF